MSFVFSRFPRVVRDTAAKLGKEVDLHTVGEGTELDKGLIERISRDARVPVIKHLDGICHVYIDVAADPQKAIRIADNAKTQRFAPCNTMETLLVHQAIESLGADPTAQTPCADVVGAMALGIVNVLTDPRTNVDQCFNALLTVELADNAAWELLIELAQAAGHPNIADSFVKAKTQEDDHVVKIKTLMRRDLVMQTK